MAWAETTLLVSNAPGRCVLFPATSICTYICIKEGGFIMDPYDTHIITIPLYLLADWMELKNYAKPSVSHRAFNLQRSLDSWVSAAFACHCRTMAQNVHTSFPSANSRRSCPCVSFGVVWPVNSTATAYIYVKYSARCIWAYANFTFRQKQMAHLKCCQQQFGDLWEFFVQNLFMRLR